MDSIGTLVLIVASAAIGLAAVVAVVQLWRHQPVHDDQLVRAPRRQPAPSARSSPDTDESEDETVDLSAEDSTAHPGADEETTDLAEVEKTVSLKRPGRTENDPT